MVTRWADGIVMSLLIAVLVLAGCAKRPATTQASAPAPTGAAAPAPRVSAPTPGASSAAAPTPAPAPAQPGRATTAAQPAPTPAPAAPSETARPAPGEFVSVPELRDIHFDFDKYDIRPGDAQALDANATFLKSKPEFLVLIEGHADERGTNAYNLALGERRAKATMNYLVSQGVQASRITIISYGEERPQCMEKNEGCWSKNRRAHFLVKPR